MLVLLYAFMLMAMGVGAMGGLRSFAASAKSNNQREESGRSGYLPEFSVVQTQRMAAVEPKVPDATSLTNDRFYDQT
jgi:hypothetical protein